MTSMHGFGLGLATKNNAGEILEVFYPKPLCNLSGDLAELLSNVTGQLDTAALNELASALITLTAVAAYTAGTNMANNRASNMNIGAPGG